MRGIIYYGKFMFLGNSLYFFHMAGIAIYMGSEYGRGAGCDGRLNFALVYGQILRVYIYKYRPKPSQTMADVVAT